MDNIINLKKKHIDDILAHARSEYPNECCGILAGKNNRVHKLFRTTNSDRSQFRYTVEPLELIVAYKEIREKGWDLLAVYHSHIRTDAYPSPADIRSAFLPKSVYIIVSLSDPGKPIIKGFGINEGKITEIELKIIL